MLEVDELVRNADRRTGFKIVNYREIAIPVFSLKVLSSVESVSKISVIEEFILRALENDIRMADEISNFLGLASVIVTKQIGSMIYEGVISITSEIPIKYGLTEKGRLRLAELDRRTIKKETLPFYLDGITREIIPVSNRQLYLNRDLTILGVESIPPIPRRPPKVNELDVLQMNSTLEALSGGSESEKRIVRVDAIVGKTYLNYRPAVALAFKSESGRSTSIGVMIDGNISFVHERALAKNDEIRKIRVFSEIFDSKRRRQDILKARKEIDEDLFFDTEVGVHSKSKDNKRAKLTLRGKNQTEKEVSRVGIKTLSVYDHPPLLRKAIADAKIRLLIISPWIREKVVDDQFLGKLEQCLKRGVEVIIAYGIGRDDKGAKGRDVETITELKLLDSQYKNFSLIRKRNTHAKILIMDSEFFVTTSFNWLSFRGDPNQPFREEEGILVSDVSQVDEYYSKLVEQMYD